MGTDSNANWEAMNIASEHGRTQCNDRNDYVHLFMEA